jgi:hypothetical protein
MGLPALYFRLVLYAVEKDILQKVIIVKAVYDFGSNMCFVVNFCGE